MARIEQSRDGARALSVHRVFGELSLDEALAHTQRYNAMGPDFRTLWDFSEGRLPDAEDERFARQSQARAEDLGRAIERPDRFVAIAAGEARDLEMLRAWSGYAMRTNPRISWRVFTAVDDALAWLMAQRPAPD